MIQFEVALTLVCGVLFTCFLIKVLGKKTSAKWDSILTVVIYTVGGSLYQCVPVPKVDAWLFVVPFVYSLVCLKGKFAYKLYWNTLMIAVYLSISNLCTLAFVMATQHTVQEITQPSILHILFAIAFIVAVCAGLYLLSRKYKPAHLSAMSLAFTVVLNATIVGVTELLVVIGLQMGTKGELYLILASFALCIVALPTIFYEIVASHAVSLAQPVAQQEQMQLEREEQLRELYKNIGRVHHDFNNHLQVASNLLEGGNHQESKAYLMQLERERIQMYATGNLSLDSLLTVKEKDLRMHGIAFDCELCPLPHLPLADTIFCGLVGNLLNNAMEALQRCNLPPEQMRVSLKIQKVRAMFFVECTNSCDPAHVHQHGEIFLSSKRDNAQGMGLQSIAQAVSRVQGSARFTCEDGQFSAKITLPDIDQKREGISA